jgi:hypothetical protein
MVIAGALEHHAASCAEAGLGLADSLALAAGFSAAVIAASGACLAPQFLQNLAFGESGLPHWEQFMVCNREKSPLEWPLGGIAALAMRGIWAGFCALA